MAEMIFEPFAASLRFSFPEPVEISKWSEILAHFMEMLAALCERFGPCVIGHLKGLALLEEGLYIRVSAISSSLPAQIETNASGQFPQVTLTLNMLVYGLPRGSLAKIAQEAAASSGAPWSGRVTIEPAGTII